MQFLRWLGKSLVRQILCAMLLGILIGYILLKAEMPQSAEYFQILGEFFTKALRAVAPILVFVLITHAISRHQQGQARGLKTIIALYVIGTFAAAAVALGGADATPPLQTLTLAAGRYAVLEHRGAYAELHRAYDWLYRDWLLQSPYRLADAPCIKECRNDWQTTPPQELLTDIWLPLASDGDNA